MPKISALTKRTDVQGEEEVPASDTGGETTTYRIAISDLPKGFATEIDLAAGGEDYVSSGYTVSSTTGLDVTIATGTALCGGIAIVKTSTTDVTVNDADTNWIFLGSDGTFDVQTGSTQPATPADHVPIAKAVASGGSIDSSSDIRPTVPAALDLADLGGSDGQVLTRNASLPDGAEFAEGGTTAIIETQEVVGNVQFDGGVPSGADNIQGVAWKDDGTKFFAIDAADNKVHSYTVSTAWTFVDGVTHQNTLDASTEAGGNASTLFVTNNGTRLFVGDNNGASSAVYQYNLSTGWDLSTASYSNNSLDTSTEDESIRGLTGKGDGTKFFLSGDQNANLYSYSMTTGGDLSTASYDSVSHDVSTEDGSPKGVSSDGSDLILAGSTNDNLYSYSLSTTWDLSSLSYDSVSADISGRTTAPQGLFVGNTGSKLYIGNNGPILEWDLNTAWDLSTLDDGTRSSVDFTSGIDGTYETYELDISDLEGDTDNFQVQIRVSTDGGSTWESGASAYRKAIEALRADGTTGTDTSTGASEMAATLTEVGNAAGEGASLDIAFSGPANTSLKQLFKISGRYFDTTGDLVYVDGSGSYETAEAIDGIRVKLSTGNVRAGRLTLRAKAHT